MNKEVTLIARNIQVTATNQSKALRYIREDAFEFIAAWNYEDVAAIATDAALTYDANNAAIDISMEIPAGRGERIWTGDVTFTLVVDAPAEQEAFVAARSLLAA